MAESYLPAREADLVGFAQNLSTKISATPTAYGLAAAQATAFATLFTDFRNAYFVLQDPTTKSPTHVAAKNLAKEAMVDGPNGIRQLVNLIQAHPGITAEQLVDLRLTVRDREPSPVPPPADPPVLNVVSTLGRAVRINLRDFSDSERRGRPEGVAGATILMFVGENAPVDPTQWIYCKSTTKTSLELDFAPNVPAGAKVWLTAFWKNRREEPGPAAVPVSARLGDTLAMAA